MTSPMYFKISSALAIGAPSHGLNRYPKVNRSLSERTPGYLWVHQVPPKVSWASSTTKLLSGHSWVR